MCGAYKAVIFDIGGVLTESAAAILLMFERSLELPAGSLLATMVQDKLAMDYLDKLENGKISVFEYDEQFMAEAYRKRVRLGGEITGGLSFISTWGRFREKVASAGLTHSTELTHPLSEALETVGAPDSHLVRRDMQHAIEVLKERGYKIALLTNNFWLDNAKTQSFGKKIVNAFSGTVDAVIESCVVGSHKPEPAIFNECTSKLQVPASQCVCLDDSEYHVNAARHFGMTTILVTGAQEALHELEQVLGLDENTLRL